ncbi:MAG: lysine exporter LysO family protein [Firmicutes bacterium]|nr:lysine exporter LysO family protein [Bacillota bacterium]
MLTLQILVAVTIGIVWGKLYPTAPIWQSADSITTFALYALLFLIGVELSQNRQVWQEIKIHGWRLLLVPAGVVVGTLAGGALASLVLAMPTRDALAVAAGFGWYSLTGVMLSQMGRVELGALAFITNVLRELFAIICIPLVAHHLGSMVAIAPGGATTMDTTLPLIAEATQNEATVAAFINGAILSALVPILVPLFIG